MTTDQHRPAGGDPPSRTEGDCAVPQDASVSFTVKAGSEEEADAILDRLDAALDALHAAGAGAASER